MDLVKKLKCEKKLEDLLDKNYATSNESESDNSCLVINYPKTTDRTRSKTKPKRRWHRLFKSKKSGDPLWDEAFRKHRSSMDVSENQFGSFADENRNPYNDPAFEGDRDSRYCSATNYFGETDHQRLNHFNKNDLIECEKFWKNNVISEFNADERDLLAESLFSHIWKTQGKESVSRILGNFDAKSLARKADDYFENGCQLWGSNYTQAAHVNFERSRRIREIQSVQKSLVYIQHLPNDDNNNLALESAESNAELYFVLGMVQTAKENLYASLKEFRRAMQIAALGLGMEHELTKASLYMIRSTCLAMGQTKDEIQHSISLLACDIEHEIVADKLFAKGQKEQALVEYANLKLLYDSDSMVQARIISKMARIFEEKRDFSKAMDLWTDLLLLYNETPSLGLNHPLARHALAKVIEARRQIQP